MAQDAENEIDVDPYSEGERLDAYLARKLVAKYSRTRIKKLIEDGNVQINGRSVSPHYHVKNGDRIQVREVSQPASGTRAEDIPLTILYEDTDLIVVDKPAGLVVHPAYGNLEHTLVNALLYHTQSLSKVGGEIRPGIVHRLDKDTSGIMVVAKNDRAHRSLAKQFKNHTIERMYMVAVRGVVQHNEGLCEEAVGRAFLNRKKVIVKPAGGKDATTFFQVEKRYSKHSLLRVYPKTGRTHQIRVHMAHLGHPVLGDSLYGVMTPWIQRQALHAKKLGFFHPTLDKTITFESDYPEDFKFLLAQLESQG